MYPSYKNFMEQLIDYAGLFPPAALPLEQAIRNYAAYQNDKDAWMLGRFILPSSQLHDLDPYMDMFTAEQPLSLSVLGSRSHHPELCVDLLDESLRQIAASVRRYGAAVSINVLELPLPPVTIESTLMNAIATRTSNYDLQIFCEMTSTMDADWETSMMQALDEIEEFNAINNRRIGIKLRTGGVTAEAFPLPGQVAAVLVGCRERNLAMKFTAGLHHPIRMYRHEVKTSMHGFLNVFFAGLFAHVNRLDVKATGEILAEENPASFRFSNDSLHWRHLSVDAGEVLALRNQVLFSFGSCSFDEPRDEIKSLNLFEQRSL
jgi:hypothetical protein